MKNIIYILAAFIIGQLIQLGAQAFSKAMSISESLALCAGVGALVTIAVCVGIALAKHVSEEPAADLPEVFGDEN